MRTYGIYVSQRACLFYSAVGLVIYSCNLQLRILKYIARGENNFVIKIDTAGLVNNKSCIRQPLN